MGKTIKATELKNVRIDFVSLVDKGANGFPFKFIKSEYPVIDMRKKAKRKTINI